jgi:trehalose 6-phosphate synthase complex regulatory subunit
MQDDSISVPPLEFSRILPRYKHSRKRLILIDFEDTLWSRDLSRAGLVGMGKGEYVFPEQAVNVLGKLVKDVRNEVWLLSGLRIDGVLDSIREKVPKVGIMYVFF